MAIVCDTHVHCYQYGQLGELLNQAANNFASAVPQAEQKVLFFTDGKTDKTWSRLTDSLTAGESPAGWRLLFDQSVGMIAAENEEHQLYLAPARQLVSAERLEFLLLGCDENIADGLADADIIEQYAEPYVVISPWGVGKWLGRRGGILRDLIEQRDEHWFLGDNGGRPWFWWGVSQCRQARAKKMAIYNGSDPLPIDGELRRVGTFGIYHQDALAQFDLPTLLSSLKHDAANWHNYGSALGMVDFVKGRLAMSRR